MENNETCKECEGKQNLICCKMQKAGLRCAVIKLKRCIESEKALVLLAAIANSLEEYPCTPCKVLKARVDWVYEQVEEVGCSFLTTGTNDLLIILAEEMEALIS